MNQQYMRQFGNGCYTTTKVQLSLSEMLVAQLFTKSRCESMRNYVVVPHCQSE